MPLKSQFIRFLIAGGIAAACNFGSRFVYSMVFSYEVAIVLAFVTGLVTGFVMMRRHVFSKRQGKLAPQAIKFLLVNLLALVQTLVISITLSRWVLPAAGLITHAEAIAHLVGVLTPAVTSYFAHKLYTFQ